MSVAAEPAAGDAARPGDLLDHQHDVEDGPAAAAVGGGHGHAHEACRGKVLHVVPGVLLARVPAGRALGEHAVGEVARPPPQRLLLGRQLEIHGRHQM
jgi:hypothetical protein